LDVICRLHCTSSGGQGPAQQCVSGPATGVVTALRALATLAGVI
jgi:hypothetical protein